MEIPNGTPVFSLLNVINSKAFWKRKNKIADCIVEKARITNKIVHNFWQLCLSNSKYQEQRHSEVTKISLFNLRV